MDLCIRHIVTAGSTLSDVPPRKTAFKGLARLSNKLYIIVGKISSLPSDDGNVCLLQQHEQQLSEIKKELSDIRSSLLSFDLEEGNDVIELHSAIEKDIFYCSLQIKELLHSSMPTSTARVDKGVKLPKINVPTCDGNILNWKIFWEQFHVSVHARTGVSDSEKLIYLQHALKDGKARSVIEGLSRSGERYTEGVESLKSRYDWPCLIHQARVRMILEAPSLKDGSGRELCQFHDTVQQHLHALKAMGHELSSSFIASMFELKLDMNTMFEWQQHNQASIDFPLTKN